MDMTSGNKCLHNELKLVIVLLKTVNLSKLKTDITVTLAYYCGCITNRSQCSRPHPCHLLSPNHYSAPVHIS